MDIERIRAEVVSALTTMTAEEIAADVGVTPNTVRNFSRPGHGLRRDSLRAFEGWLQRQGLLPSGNRGRRPAVEYEALPHTIEAVVRQGQRELVDWAAEFAARVLEASAARVRELPAWVTEEELAEDDRVMDQIEAAAEQAKAAKKKGKRASA